MNLISLSFLFLWAQVATAEGNRVTHSYLRKGARRLEQTRVIEGDIIPTYKQIVLEYGDREFADKLVEMGVLDHPEEEQEPGTRKLGLSTQIWTSRVKDVVVIPYQFETSTSFNTFEQTRIVNALNDLSTRSGVVRFVRRTFQQSNAGIQQQPYIVFSRVSGSADYCGSSMVGQVRNRQVVYIGCITRGVIQHEILHALGFWHEHTRPDRDQYVEIRWENIIQQFFDNFRIRTNAETLSVDYDYGSVMHYRALAFSKNRRKTIGAYGKTYGQRIEASDVDILQLRLLYQCKSGPRQLRQYEGALCTWDCPCWANARGCFGNNNRCQGDLVCVSNQCVHPGSVEPTCASSPCQNGATCNDGIDSYTCNCVEGYTGDNCEKEINECDSSPCQNGGSCRDGVNSYTCTCAEGFTGTNCDTAESTSFCINSPCENGATCNDGIDSYTCNCVEGYTGYNCDTEINECDSSPCQNGGSCSVGVNSYTCTCAEGFAGTNCDTAESTSFCINSPCENGATCNDGIDSYTCNCVEGYTGYNCDTEINECDPSPCQNGGSCRDGVNSYTCTCVEGFTGINCATSESTSSCPDVGKRCRENSDCCSNICVSPDGRNRKSCQARQIS